MLVGWPRGLGGTGAQRCGGEEGRVERGEGTGRLTASSRRRTASRAAPYPRHSGTVGEWGSGGGRRPPARVLVRWRRRHSVVVALRASAASLRCGVSSTHRSRRREGGRGTGSAGGAVPPPHFPPRRPATRNGCHGSCQPPPSPPLRSLPSCPLPARGQRPPRRASPTAGRRRRPNRHCRLWVCGNAVYGWKAHTRCAVDVGGRRLRHRQSPARVPRGAGWGGTRPAQGGLRGFRIGERGAAAASGRGRPDGAGTTTPRVDRRRRPHRAVQSAGRYRPFPRPWRPLGSPPHQATPATGHAAPTGGST